MPRGGKRDGAGRRRLSTDGTLRKPHSFSITDNEYSLLKACLSEIRRIRHQNEKSFSITFETSYERI